MIRAAKPASYGKRLPLADLRRRSLRLAGDVVTPGCAGNFAAVRRDQSAVRFDDSLHGEAAFVQLAKLCANGGEQRDQPEVVRGYVADSQILVSSCDEADSVFCTMEPPPQP